MSGSSRVIISFGPGRPPISPEYKVSRDNVQQKADLNNNQTNPNLSLQNKSKYPNDASVKVKLEAAKRRLHEGYQEVENGLSSVALYHLFKFIPAIVLNYEVDFSSITC